jgi:hypothetical protein
LIPHRFQRKNI